MAGVQVGGLNIKIGVDLDALVEGAKQAGILLRDFAKDVEKVKLAGAIKGDPFSETIGHVKTARSALNKLFEEYAKGSAEVERAVSTPLKKLQTRLAAAITEFDELRGKIAARQGEKQDKIAKGISTGTEDARIENLRQQYAAFAKEIKELYAMLNRVDTTLGSGARKMIAESKSKEGAIKREKDALLQLSAAINRYKTEIELGINVDKNKIKLTDALIKKQQILKNLFGVELRGGDASRLEKLLADQRKQELITYRKSKMIPSVDKDKQAIDLSVASNLIEATKRRSAAIHQLREEENKLRAGIAIKMDVERNEIALQRNIEKQLQLTASGTKRAIELEKELAEKKNKTYQQALVAKERGAIGGVAMMKPETNALLQEHSKLIVKLRLRNVELANAISQGVNVEKNRLEIWRNSQKLQETGIQLSGEEIKNVKLLQAYKLKEYEDSKRVQTATTEQHRIDQRLSESRVEVLKRRLNAIRELQNAELRFRAEIRAGVNVKQNELALLKNLEAQKKLGYTTTAKGLSLEKEINRARATVGATTLHKLVVENKELTKQLRKQIDVKKNAAKIERNLIEIRKLTNKELVKYSARIKKVAAEELATKAKADRSGGFLSPTWLKRRLVWFVQLRLAWGVYRGIQKTIRDVVDAHDQLARAMRTARSPMMKATEIAQRYTEALSLMTIKHGLDFKDVGEALYQLGSAGLSAEEGLAALDSTLSLIVGTEGDAKEITKMVAGIYKNYGDTLGENITIAEKFQKINDTIAVTWQHHQMEIGEFNNALKQSVQMARVAGIGFQDLTAILGVAHDNFIRGGLAGRALRTILMRLSRDSVEFAKAFRVENIFDPTKPIKFMEIMKVLNERMRGGVLSAYSLSVAFERLGLRGAPLFEALVQSWDEVEKARQRYEDGLDATRKIEEERMKSLSKQMKRLTVSFPSAMITLFMSVIDRFEKTVKGLADIAEKITTRSGKTSIQKGILDVETINKRIRNMIKEERIGVSPIELSAARRFQERETAREAELAGLKKWLEDLKKLGTTENLEADKAIKAAGYQGRASAQTTIKRQIEELEPQIKHNLLLAVNALFETIEDLAKRGIKPSKPDMTPIDYGKLEVERELERINKEPIEKLKLITQDISDLQDTIKEKYVALNNLRKAGRLEQVKFNVLLKEEGVKSEKTKNQWKVSLDHVMTLKGAMETLLKEEEKIKKLVAEEKQARLKVLEPTIKDLGFQDKKIAKEAQSLELQRKIDNQAGLTNEEYKKQLDVNYDIAMREKERASIAMEVALYKDLENEHLDEILDLYDESIYKADQHRKQLDQATESLRLQTKLREINLEYDKELDRLAALKQQYLIEDGRETERILDLNIKIAKIEKERLEKNKEVLELGKKNLDTDEKSLRMGGQMRDKQRDITDEMEKQDRFLSPMYDTLQKMKAEVGDLREVWRKMLGTGVGTATSGLTNIFQSATGGFQEQRQEVVNLESELKGLGQEYSEAISEGDLIRAQQINAQMEELKKNIKDLKDPVKQLGDAFHDFFKDLVDNMREVLNKWIAMQIVMGLVKVFTPMPTGANAAGGYGTSTYNVDYGAARGGVLPQIKSFQSFSRGGLTGRPTLALLGDNRSKRELVIPEENIKRDSVSGYSRDSQKEPINIINVLTQDDVVGVLSGVKGKRVILNTIGQDLHRKGPTYRSLNA